MSERADDATLDGSHSPVDGPTRTVDRTPGFVRGSAVGRYLLLAPLGAGAMGVVFAAYDPELDRKIALKLLKPGGTALARSRGRLQREAQALAKLGHPNVVAVYDVGVHDEQVFIAMEFVEGQTLRRRGKSASRCGRSEPGTRRRTRRGLGRRGQRRRPAKTCEFGSLAGRSA
jgi:serine/threonine protein kinase